MMDFSYSLLSATPALPLTSRHGGPINFSAYFSKIGPILTFCLFKMLKATLILKVFCQARFMKGAVSSINDVPWVSQKHCLWSQKTLVSCASSHMQMYQIGQSSHKESSVICPSKFVVNVNVLLIRFDIFTICKIKITIDGRLRCRFRLQKRH